MKYISRRLVYICIVLAAAIALLVVVPVLTAGEDSPPEITSLRGRNSKTFDNGDGTRTFIGTEGAIHYKDELGDWQDINNEIVAASPPWDYEMTQAGYTTRFLSDFTAGQVVEWERNGSTLAFQPMGLEWTNDLNQIDLVSMPQDMACIVSNTPQTLAGRDFGTETGTIRWDNAYGTGRNFWWECDTSNLNKVLELESPLPEPPQYILDGGNPVLRLNFIFDPSSDLDMYVDGELWDKNSRVMTFNYTEFRKEEVSMWYFGIATAYDAAEEAVIIETELRRVGSSFYVSVRVPYEWLSEAAYPVRIDPVLFEEYAHIYDCYWQCNMPTYASTRSAASASTYLAYTWLTFGQSFSTTYWIMRGGMYYDTSGLGSSVTIDSASLWFYIYSDQSDDPFYLRVMNGQPTYPSSTPTDTDYYYPNYSGDGGEFYSEDISGSGYYELEIDSEDLSWINKTGTTKLFLRSREDINNSSPGGNEYWSCRSANYSGTTQDPYIEVWYTAPAVGYSWGTIIG